MWPKKQQMSLRQPVEHSLYKLNRDDRVWRVPERASVKRSNELVNKYPEQSLYIIRAWMYQDS